MRIETAEISLIGHREDNQDRVKIAASDRAALLVVADGMGGHSDGGRAAQVALNSMMEAFREQPHPIFDPQGFLHLALGRAHDDVVKLGEELPMEARPRATCAVCLVQDGAAHWAHIGDSRVYHLRGTDVVHRTRDHSHVEVLLREGLITEAEIQGHPMRNFVECCLGGDAAVPEMSVGARCPLEADDLLLLCTDGVWSNLSDTAIAGFCSAPAATLQVRLQQLCERAVQASAPYSDNTTAAALRFLGAEPADGGAADPP